MKTKTNILFALTILTVLIFASCKKSSSTTSTSTPTTTASYTKGILTNVTIMSIPNPSTFYDANGADIFWRFWVNNDTGAPLIDGSSSAKVNVLDSQFPLIYDYSTSGYPVFLSSNANNANYFIKVYDEDINNDAQSSNQLIGEISFTWSELVANGSMIGNAFSGHVTKTVNGTSVQVAYTLQ